MRGFLTVVAIIGGLLFITGQPTEADPYTVPAASCKCENCDCCQCEADLAKLQKEVADLRVWAKATEGYINEYVKAKKPELKAEPVVVQRAGHWEQRCFNGRCTRVWVWE